MNKIKKIRREIKYMTTILFMYNEHSAEENVELVDS